MRRSINYNKLYKEYSKEYNRAEISKRVSGFGAKLYSEKLSQAEFKVSAKLMRKDGYQPMQIVNELVKEQKYQYSYKQGKLFKEAAEKSGFCDAKYFSRVVKEAYGVSPSKLYNHIKTN